MQQHPNKTIEKYICEYIVDEYRLEAVLILGC